MVRLLGLFLACCIIVGCQTAPKPAPTTAPQQPPSKGLIKQVLYQLGQGEAEEAKQSLQVYLKSYPDHAFAKDLLRQINVDPELYFGPEHFVRRVKAGDSLSSLSDKYLKDATKFYILARYNSIKNPSKIRLGQKIKIPGKEPTKVVKRSVTSIKLERKSKSLIEKKAFGKVISLLEENSAEVKKSPELKELLLLSYLNASAIAETKQDDKTAILLLKKSKKLSGSTTAITKGIANLENKLKAKKLYNDSQLKLRQGDSEAALALLAESLQVRPGFGVAQTAYNNVKVQLIDSYHKEALISFRKQELDKAVSYWSKVLHLAPGHKGAKSYIGRAIEMREQLQSL